MSSILTPARLLLASVLFFAVHAAAGGSSGTRGGGNIDVAEFYDRADLIINSLMAQSPIQVESQTIDITILQKNLKLVKVQSLRSELTLNGAAVDAINDPEAMRIDFSEPRWRSLTDESKTRLILHELLGLSRISDLNYGVSSTLLKKTDFKSDEICHELRTFYGEKAKHLIRTFSMLGLKPQGKKQKYFTLKKIDCGSTNDNAIGDDFASAQCASLFEDSSRAGLLLEALQAVGVWGEGAMSHVYYSADFIFCRQSQETFDYSCQIKANWDWACQK